MNCEQNSKKRLANIAVHRGPDHSNRVQKQKILHAGQSDGQGVYTLDRPLTVIEAIARARGFENGLVDRNIIDLADFQRSFVIRQGKRIPLNFEKLFQEGDLSQNIAIEPEDYFYFPSTNMKEVYVVGEVRLPGPVTYTPDITIIGGIALVVVIPIEPTKRASLLCAVQSITLNFTQWTLMRFWMPERLTSSCSRKTSSTSTRGLSSVWKSWRILR